MLIHAAANEAMRATATSPDVSITELGDVGADQATRLFREHPWAAEIERAEMLGARGPGSVSPDLTFTDLPAHMIVSGEKPDRFNVEISLPRERKVLGLFPTA